MPRKQEGARLLLRKRKGRKAVYVIKDEGGRETSTGTGDLGQAEIRLSEYVQAKHAPSGPSKADDFLIQDALVLYAEQHCVGIGAPERQAYAIQALLPFWGALTLTAINGPTCRRYAAWRGVSDGTIRRELNAMQAAVNFCFQEGYVLTAPKVTLPKKPPAKNLWLSREDVQTVLYACKEPRRRHLIPFIKTSIWTGTRKKAVLNLRIDEPNVNGGWIDTKRGILNRSGTQEAQTNKRRSAAKAPAQLVRYAKLLKSRGNRFMVEFNGSPVKDVKTGFKGLREDTGIEFSPHTLKHTAITWAIQDGMEITDAAEYFSTSIETITRVYWHHSPKYQQRAVEVIENRSKK